LRPHPKQAPNRARIRHPRGVGLACSLDNILSINGLVQQPAPAPISSSTAPRERPWLGQGLTSVVAPAPIFQVRPAAKGGGRRFPGRRSVSEANLRVAYRHIPWGGQSGPTEYSWQGGGGGKGVENLVSCLYALISRAPVCEAVW